MTILLGNDYLYRLLHLPMLPHIPHSLIMPLCCWKLKLACLEMGKMLGTPKIIAMFRNWYRPPILMLFFYECYCILIYSRHKTHSFSYIWWLVVEVYGWKNILNSESFFTNSATATETKLLLLLQFLTLKDKSSLFSFNPCYSTLYAFSNFFAE